jgi:hypothetical protein
VIYNALYLLGNLFTILLLPEMSNKYAVREESAEKRGVICNDKYAVREEKC